MAAGRWTVYSKAKKKLFNGSIRLGVDIFKILLVQTTSNFATLTLSTVGSLTNQIASAGGYTQQGLTMVVQWTVGASAGAYQFSMSPIIQTATGAAMVNIRAAVIKNSAGHLLCFATMTTNQFSVPSGSTITLAPTAGGIFTLSNPIAAASITPAVRALAITGQAPSVTVGNPGIITTMTLVNTSGSTQATNFVTRPFGHPFKKGNITAGNWPKFELTDGTNIPVTIWGKSTWSDGSWKFGCFMLRVPSSIAGSGTLTINIRGTGTNPGSSSRSTSDLSAQDLKVILTGIDNLSGVWTSTLNQGITDNDDVVVFADGPAGKIWRIRQQYMQSGSNHGQLECYHYVAALQNSAGGLYGIRWLPRTGQPWIDVSSPTPQKRGFTAAMQNGASTAGLTQPVAFAPNAYTITNGNVRITATGSNYQSGTPIRLSAASSPFNTTTTYYTQPYDADSWQLSPTASDALHAYSVITPLASGSGTATPHIEIVQYASFFGANADGTWQYLQGGGSVAAEATVRCQFNTTYWRSTKLVPPYDLSVSPTSNSSYSYNPMTAGPIARDIGRTGERDDIGLLPAWYARAFYTQAAVDEQVVRVTGLAFASGATGLRRSTTGNVPVVNNGPDNVGGTYTGLGSPNTTLEWNGVNLISGIVVPSGDLTGAWDINRTDHWPSCYPYAYMLTGEPQFQDLVAENANYLVLSRWTVVRNFTVSGTDYYGCTFRSDGGPRGDAWPTRDLGLAIAMLPDTAVDGSAIRTYLSDCLTAGLAMMLAYNPTQNAFWNTNGVSYFNVINGGGLPWQWSYQLAALAYIYGATEVSNVLTLLNYLIKFPNAVDADIGIYFWTAYVNRMRLTNDGEANGQPSTAIITAMNQMYFETVPGAGDFVITTAATGLCTYVAGNSRVTFTNGDGFLAFGPAQANLANNTAYYMVNVTDPGPSSSKTFQLAATPGGTPITFTGGAGGPIAELSMYRCQVIPSGANAIGIGFFGADSYTPNARMSFRICEANGATGISTIRVKMDTYWNNMAALGVSFTGNPKFALTTTY